MQASLTGPIVVATDFSDHASAAFDRAMLIARAHDLPIVLVHALGLDVPAYWMGVIGERWPLIERESEVHARRQLEAMGQRGRSEHGVQVEIRIERGFASASIAAAAASVSASLVVAGAHGAGLVHRILMGSTSSRLVRKCAGPVLVVKRAAEVPYRRALVPIDFSASSLECIRAAQRHAPAAALTLLHATAVPFGIQMREAGISEDLIGTYEVAGREQGRVRLREAARSAGLEPSSHAEVVVSGDPSQAICTHAASGEFDLIVMGKHGLHISEHLLLGSVTKNVLAEADCDVLVVASREAA
jgi:nucleotide-binding universal stress UspA family protein